MSRLPYPESSHKSFASGYKIALALALSFGILLWMFSPLIAIFIAGPRTQGTVIEVQNNCSYPVQIYTDYYSHTPQEVPNLIGIVSAGKTTQLRYALPIQYNRNYHLIVADAKGTMIGDVFDNPSVIKPPVSRIQQGGRQRYDSLWHVNLPQDVVSRPATSRHNVNDSPK